KPFDLVRLRRSLLQAVERNSLLVENRHYQQELEQKVLFRTQGLNQALKEVEDSYRVTLEALVTALDAREHETHSHSKRVCAYTERLARQLGVNGSALVEIGRGALLHDVGKIGVPDSILLKPARLTDAEWRVMKRHPRTGHDILGGIRFLSAAAEIVLSHQERWDGHGYPQGLAGKDIPIGARIFAVVDTLDAMTSDRPYRKALSFQAAIEEIRRCSGTQFDPCIVDAFLSIPAPNWVEIHDALNTEDALRNPFALLCRT
ncbi:MAG: HD domain-containing protein, partial [Acidobacteria bacterium]|nr:HD domain-containing protein [Acidobacteriota bacterium]